jgi:hypothetical protein
MDFPGYQLPEELRLLQQTVRRFVVARNMLRD